jgi:FMN phosphatase YigB (HAD superfamily)
MTDRLAGIGTITFDFGNTLVPVSRSGLRRVVELTADAMCGRWPDLERTAFLAAWAEERTRQFREDVPRFREVDLAERLIRVLARLRGMDPPPDEVPWDQERAAERSDAADVAWGVERYSRAFVDGLPETPGVTQLLARLADERDVAILSNWPLAATIDRYAEAHGWLQYLSAIVVSQRVGTIKPRPEIFEAARSALGDPEPGTILHVGDDWVADVVGASGAGWRTAWLVTRIEESELPSSERDWSVEPDLTLAFLGELVTRLGEPLPPSGSVTRGSASSSDPTPVR